MTTVQIFSRLSLCKVTHRLSTFSMPIRKDKCQEALGYWTIGLQYLHLVEVVIAETVAQRNAHIVFSNTEISRDQYERDARWSDHRLVIPLLFVFYHGIEVILKGFLVAAGASPETNHKLSQLVSAFEEQFPGHAIGTTVRKYIAEDKLPEVLASFCKTSGITIDAYYQALKYPHYPAAVFSFFVLRWGASKPTNNDPPKP